ncbi:MAG: bifunctional DNA-binding transcriptional regulator/O6-methylguanine-DNA methyltransferase Ada [Chloroflexales bacterium]|nr:bifunctional DNA-binding transcriptional regulator/O6-methylguanine-DNA methyltransferase Ada [Chloroflexales bacterium]
MFLRETTSPMQTGDEEAYWRAVLDRDAGCDGTFVYAVRSTGIYCKPSCAARRPRREHTVFFARPEAAEQAGYRACKRCCPQPGHVSGVSTLLVEKVCRYIEDHLDDTLTLEYLGAQLGLSPYHLQRTFKHVMGITPRQYVDARRLDRLRNSLKEGQNVTEALYEAGYSSSSRLYERAAGQLGMTPATYRRGGAGMQIDYAIANCILGRLLVAATERGICFVSLGDADEPLEVALHSEFPAAAIQRDDERLRDWVTTIILHLSGQRPQLDLPLDVQATAFQRQVWEALQAIPYGETRTYGEIARQLGNPKAVRAVGRACATNPVSLVVPCHRAIGSDGGLHGYRWGLERKQALLEQEKHYSLGLDPAKEE